MYMDPHSILGQSHDLEHEFPEYAELLEDLRTRDWSFKKLCDEYHQVNREIIRIEHRLTGRSQEFVEGLKKRRLACKDKVYSRLRTASMH